MRNIFVLAALVMISGCASGSGAMRCAAPAHEMGRVELLFGAALNDGTPIDNRQWQDFLDREVTPRFPSGLTAYEAYGQWQDSNGKIEKSPSRVLVIWYGTQPDMSVRIDAVREAYKKLFKQTSVMRVDGADCVSF
ncbi:MAG TPA: DUF3574 domain-containing protein [Rhizomicrobium sp.]|jgi:hypothetical protein